jgi:hypothetical protein
VAEILIRLERPASLTPELRVWIEQRLAGGRAVFLARSRPGRSGPADLVLRFEEPESEPQEDVTDLLTDLRLLGLRPTLVSEPAG